MGDLTCVTLHLWHHKLGLYEAHALSAACSSLSAHSCTVCGQQGTDNNLAVAAGFVPMLALNSALAFFVNLTNFLVTKTTSALTLQVCCLACPC